nr:substance P [Beringraja rhina]
AKHDKFYGLM